MDIINFIGNFSFNKEKSLEEKNDNELTIEDRLYHLNITTENNEIIKQIINLKHNENKININTRVFNDLEFFTNHNNDTKTHTTIYDKINNTKTAMGDLVFQNILNNPIKDIDVLTNRQELLKSYIDISANDLTIINNTLTDIKKLENDLKWFWDINIQKHMHVMYDIVYLNLTGINKIDNFLNKNTTLLSIFNIYRIFFAPLINILSPLSAIIIPFVLFLIFKRFLPIKINNKQFINFVLSNVFNSNILSMFSKGLPLKKKILGVVSGVLWLFFYFQNVYMSVKLSKKYTQNN